MATYPPVTRDECDAALDRLTHRHRDDPRWSEAGTEPRDVLAYLRGRHASLPRDLAARDVWDELVLSAWLYWDERRRERELLHRAHSYGLSLAELGRYLGIGTRQGTRDYLDRLDALLHENPTNATPPAPGVAELTGEYGEAGVAERDARARDPRLRPPPGLGTSHIGRRRADRDADLHARRHARAQTRTRPTRQDWLTRHHHRVAAVLTELLVQTARIGIPAHDSDPDQPAGLEDYLSWLAEDLDDDGDPDGNEAARGDDRRGEACITPATLNTLGLALGELRIHPAITGLARNHGAHQVLGAADRLRAAYADLADPTAG